MTRSIRGARRAGLLLAGAAATLLLASGCAAGQIAETANKAPGVPGLNVELRTPEGGSYKVRNLLIAYPGLNGYPAGGNAPVEVAIFNDTSEPVTVTVTSSDARAVLLTGGQAPSPSPTTAAPTGSPGTPSPGTASPTARSVTPTPQVVERPARLQIPPRSFVTFSDNTDQQIQLTGLNRALKAGGSVNLIFDFGDGRQITAQPSVRVPLTPVPAATPVVGGADHG